MKYITTIERMAEKRGERSFLIRLLNRKFGSINDLPLDRINALSMTYGRS
nr:DUF4351 domain-containing protein [Alkalinema sp. FACHB-956]